MILKEFARQAGNRPGWLTLLVAMVAACNGNLALCADLVVAQVAPDTGSDGVLASAYRAGAQLYFNSVNASGGVHGASIVIRARDDAGDPAVTRRHAAELIAQNPIAFIGAVGTTNVARVLPLLEASQTPLLGPLVDAVGVAETDSRNVFHIRPNERQEIEAIAGKLDSLGLKRIVVCHDDPRVVGEIAQWLQSQRVSGVIQVLACGGDTVQLEAAVKAVIASRAQAVVFVGREEPAAAFIGKLRARENFAMVVASSSIDAKRLTALLPAAARSWLAVAEVFPNPNADEGSIGDSVVREFSALRAASASAVPASSASLAGFVSAKILVEALRRLGEKPTAADVLRSLRALQHYDVGGMVFDFARIESPSVTYTRLGIIGGRGVLLN